MDLEQEKLFCGEINQVVKVYRTTIYAHGRKTQQGKWKVGCDRDIGTIYTLLNEVIVSNFQKKRCMSRKDDGNRYILQEIAKYA